MNSVVDVVDISNSMDLDKLYAKTLPRLSHTEQEAFAELVDNSFDADASKVDIFFNKETIVICDNGSGMSKQEVINSCAFSSKTSQNSLIGFFGCGGTAASSLLAKEKKILSKKMDEDLIVASQNLEHDVKSLRFPLPTQEDKKLFSSFCGEHGTYIELSDLRQSKTHSRTGDRKNALNSHFSQIFRKLIDGGKKITLHHDKQEIVVQAYDPLFYNDGRKTILEFAEKESVDFNGQNVNIRMSLLNKSSFGDKEKGKPSLDNQGIFFLREDREIEHKNHYEGLWTRHNDGNYERIEVQFPSSLDSEFGVQMSKNKVILDQSTIDKLKYHINPWRNKVKKFLENQREKSKDVDLSKESEIYTKNLLGRAASMGIPLKRAKDGTPSQKKDGNKKGTVNPKGTGIIRSQAKEKYDLPNWNEVCDPNNHSPHWFDEGTITLNLSASFTKEFLINGDEKTKKLYRHLLAAEYFVLRSYLLGSDEEAVVNAFLAQLREKMVNIHKQLT